MNSRDSGEPIQRDPISRSSGGDASSPDEDWDQSEAVDEDEALSPTDTEPSSPHGVGESVSRGGEDIEDAEGKEAGRKDSGTEGKARRPTGTSEPRDTTSVDPDNT